MNDELIIERRGHVTRLTINRPDVRNALSIALIQRIAAALRELSFKGWRKKCGNRGLFCDHAVRAQTCPTDWLGRQDSNLGMAESKSAALPLGYAPNA
jgi:hypothetical protein